MSGVKLIYCGGRDGGVCVFERENVRRASGRRENDKNSASDLL